MDTNGIISPAFAGGESVQVQLSANGEYLACAEFNTGDEEADILFFFGSFANLPDF